MSHFDLSVHEDSLDANESFCTSKQSKRLWGDIGMLENMYDQIEIRS